MSAQYPILDNRPINKWKVAELRDELKRRSLPTKGLKDELVRRLDEAIRYETEAVEEEEAEETNDFDGESEPGGNLGNEKVESSGVEMTNEAFEHREIEVKTVVETVTTTVEVAYDQTIIDQGKPLEPEETIGNDPITMVEKPEVTDDPTKIDQGKTLEHEESVGSDPVTMIDDPTEIDQGKALEPQQIVGTDSSTVVEAPTPLSDVPDEIVLPHIISSEGNPNTENSNQDCGVLETVEKGAVLKGEPSTLEASVETVVEVMDSKVHETLEYENVEKDNNEVEGMADLPPEKAVESIEAKPESLKSSQMDADHSESYSSDKVYEVSHNLGFQVKSESFSNEILTVNEKDELKENLTADNVKLEPETVRPEMVLPSSIRDLPGDGIVHPSDDPVPQSNQTLDGETNDDKSKNIEFSENNDKKDEMEVDISVGDHNLENEAPEKVDYDIEPSVKDISPAYGLSPEQIEPSSEMITDVAASGEDKNPQGIDENDFSKTTEGADGELLEKVNFDQSSADDSMEEDTSEARLVDFDQSSSRVVEKTESNKEHVGDGGRGDVIQHGTPSEKMESSNDHKDIAALSEKRKFQDTTEAGNKELPKKQRRWNTESQEVSESQSPRVILPTTPKALLTASMKPDLTSPNSNSLLGGEAPKERVVPPSQKTPTNSLRIDHFLRPFTLKAVQELLTKTGKLCSFWMDHIKTHCYVTYSSEEEAVETRNAVYNLQWPPNGGRNLVADFVDPEEVKSRIEAPSPSAAPSVNANTSAVKAQPPPHPAAPTHPRQNHEPQHPLSRQPPTVRDPLPRVPSPVAEKPEPPIVTLDDLFRKTRNTPRIYYLPLSDEQVEMKLARQKRDRR